MQEYIYIIEDIRGKGGNYYRGSSRWTRKIYKAKKYATVGNARNAITCFNEYKGYQNKLEEFRDVHILMFQLKFIGIAPPRKNTSKG